MKIGINRWSMPAQWTLEKCFQLAHQVGFDSIEINLDESGYLTPQTSDAEAAEIRKQADRIGIELSSIATGVYWRYPFTHPEPSVREKARSLCQHQLRLARAMGVEAILVVPGIVNSEVAYEVAYQRAQDALKALVPVAKHYQAVIGVENVWNKFLLSPLEMARFLDEIGSEWVRAYFDVGNVLVFGYPEQWIRILKHRIIRVHVKDFRTEIGTIGGFTNPLQGDVPWQAVRGALQAVGYEGYITAEVESYRHQAELGVRHLAESLAALFKS